MTTKKDLSWRINLAHSFLLQRQLAVHATQNSEVSINTMRHTTHKRPGASKAPAKLQRSSRIAAEKKPLLQHTDTRWDVWAIPTAVKGRRRSAAEKRSDSAGLNPLLLYERSLTPCRLHYQRYNATRTNAYCKVATFFVHAPHTHDVRATIVYTARQE